MKIYSREQIYEADKATIAKEDIESINLMERAGGYASQWIDKQLNGGAVPIKVFCGIGNNGGDGLVIARNLLKEGYKVDTYVVNYSEKRSDDFLKAYDSLKNETKKWPLLLKSEKDFPELDNKDLIVDAIFGIGLNRPAPDWVQSLFDKINTSGAYILSIDIASGMYMDAIPKKDEVFIKPTTVLTFQAPKLVFFLPQTGSHIKNWEVIDIGLDPEYLEKTDTDVKLITKADIQKIFKPREKFTHKGTYGHSLIIGGSYGKMGAAFLASKACLKTGSGLVTAYVPQHGLPILQSSLPEVMVIPDKHNGRYLECFEFDLEPDVIGLGPGLGTEEQTVKCFGEFLKRNEAPLVIDADGLNILAKKPKYLELLPKQTVLTPHPKELERLIGEWEDDFDKLKKTAKFAKDRDLIVVIKGYHTMVMYNYNLYINDTGNPGMATGGTGDVLTGMITALIAQNYDPLQAAILGVYLHGKAGDLSLVNESLESLTAGELIEYIGKAVQDLYRKTEEVKN